MFEIFNLFVLYLVLLLVLVFYVVGCKSGLIFDSGYGIIYVVFIYDGFVVCENIFCLDCVGGYFMDYFKICFVEKDVLFVVVNWEIVCDVKEILCYVVLDYEKEMSIVVLSFSLDKSYRFLDGCVIIIGGVECIWCFEVLFYFFLVGIGFIGIY